MFLQNSTPHRPFTTWSHYSPHQLEAKLSAAEKLDYDEARTTSRSSFWQCAADTGDRNKERVFLPRLELKKKKQRLCMSSRLLPKPCSVAKFFPRGMGRSTELTDVVSSLRARACAPLKEELAAGKSTRTRKGVLAFPTDSSLSALVWFKNLLAFSAQKSHPPREKISPCPPGEADPPPEGTPGVPGSPQPDPSAHAHGGRVTLSRCRGTGRGHRRWGCDVLKSEMAPGMEGRGRAGSATHSRASPRYDPETQREVDRPFPDLTWHPTRGRGNHKGRDSLVGDDYHNTVNPIYSNTK